MTRFDDWPARLDRFFASRRALPFAWGSNDCCLFACDAVLAMTGVDLAADFRGSYSTVGGAYRVVKKVCGSSLVGKLAECIAGLHEIPEVPARFAQRGDVVLLDRELGQSLGIVSLDGAEVWALAEEGLAFLPLQQARRAWRI